MCYKQRLCKPCDCKNGCNLPCGHIFMSYMPNCQCPIHKQLLPKVEIQLLSFQNYCFLLHYFTSMSSLAFWLTLPYHEVFVCYIRSYAPLYTAWQYIQDSIQIRFKVSTTVLLVHSFLKTNTTTMWLQSPSYGCKASIRVTYLPFQKTSPHLFNRLALLHNCGHFLHKDQCKDAGTYAVFHGSFSDINYIILHTFVLFVLPCTGNLSCN